MRDILGVDSKTDRVGKMATPDKSTTNIEKEDVRKLYKNYNVLSLNERLYDNYIEVFKRAGNNVNLQNVRKRYNELFIKHYPNEATIKSSFVNKILIKTKNDIVVFELNSGESRVDICKINGISIAYEIKTEFDTLFRLEKQVRDYQRLYDKVYIICPRTKLKSVEEILPLECGIYIYNHKGNNISFKIHRYAKKRDALDAEYQLKSMTTTFLQQLCLDKKLARENSIEYCLENYNGKKINKIYKEYVKEKYHENWIFLKEHIDDILEVDYQWFYKNKIRPEYIYK
ncbi:MAG: sce7726 family protein [Alkaliphilus sp.]